MASLMARCWHEVRRRIASAAAIRAKVVLGIGADFVRFGEYTHFVRQISEFVGKAVVLETF